MGGKDPELPQNTAAAAPDFSASGKILQYRSKKMADKKDDIVLSIR